jgi:hypothetical protein
MSQGDISGFFGGAAFDPNSVEPPKDFEVLPAGPYPVQVEAAEIKATRKGDGHYFEFQLVVLDGPAKGRKLWERLNIDNPNPEAVAFALKSLGSLCRATIGGEHFGNINQLLQKTCVAHVVIRKGENSIGRYEPFGDAASVQPGPPVPPAQQQAPSQYPPQTAQQPPPPVEQPGATAVQTIQPVQQQQQVEVTQQPASLPLTQSVDPGQPGYASPPQQQPPQQQPAQPPQQYREPWVQQ